VGRQTRRAHNVRRWRDQAVLDDGQVRVKQFASNAIVDALAGVEMSAIGPLQLGLL